MKKCIAFCCLALLWLQAPAQINGTILHDGITRDYIVYLPATFSTGQSLPLVFVLHGFTQSASAIMTVTGFNALADTNNFIVAYPNGVGNAWNTNTGFPGGSTADDIGFIEALIDEFSSLYNIDTTRVYACGFSAGGYMSHRLACESGRCFAAIASVSGTMSNNAYNDCNPAEGTPVMQIHGTSDNIVNYNGGFGGKSVDDVINKWIAVNGCSASPVITPLPDLNTTDNSTVEKYQYSVCTSAKPVELLKVTGGGHQWPGTTSPLGGLGNINLDIDASQEIWNFFQPFSCPQSTSLPQLTNSQQDVLVQDLGDGSFLISFNGSEAVQGVAVAELFDISGRQMMRTRMPAGSVTLSLSDFNKGVYVLCVESGSFRQHIKLLNR